MPPRVLIIGLDGADWRVLRPFLEEGTMPNLARLIDNGTSGPLRSTIPPQSPVAWTSFLTGKNPARHSVFDFRERSPYNPTRLLGVNSRSIRSETFLQVLSRHERYVGAINIPFTFPPFKVNGVLLSGWGGMVKGAAYTYPEDFAAELNEKVNGFPLHTMEWGAMVGKLDVLIDQVIAVTRQHARTLQYVMRNKPWHVLVQVFEGLDRLQHPLMHILDTAHPRYDPSLAQRLGPKLRTYFRTVDGILGAAEQHAPSDTVLLVVSDHGFRSAHKLLNLKDVLAQLGLANTKTNLTVTQSVRTNLRHTLKPVTQRLPRRRRNPRNIGARGLMGDLDWSATKAYTTSFTSHGIWINLVGREPSGVVTPGDEYESLLSEIQDALLALRDPVDGSAVLEQVIRASDVYHGPMLDHAPDLLVVPAAGFGACSGEAGPHLAPLRKWMGSHDLDGILLAKGPGIRRGEKISHASIMDIAPTILYLADVPIPVDVDGQVLSLFADDRLLERPPTYQQGRFFHSGQEAIISAAEQAQLDAHLRRLGYL
jgi:predicted AlkP superfamily phosphohydrolase/phosphomutase